MAFKMTFEGTVKSISRTIAAVVTVFILIGVVQSELPLFKSLISSYKDRLAAENGEAVPASKVTEETAEKAAVPEEKAPEKAVATEGKSETTDVKKEEKPTRKAYDFASRTVEDMMEPRFIGPEDAAVTVYDYSSFTCGHCATFHEKTYPEIKKAYVDTGKIRYGFMDFPLDARAAVASMLSRCMPPAYYHSFVDVVFKTRKQWMFANDTKTVLKNYARLGGLSAENADACLKNNALLDAISLKKHEAMKEHNIEGTPTFILKKGDETTSFSGAVSFSSFKNALDNMLAE